MIWNFDMSQAPRDPNVKLLVAEAKGDRVRETYWLPARLTTSGKILEGDRWSAFTRGYEPLAWMLMPEHPNSLEDPPPLQGVTTGLSAGNAPHIVHHHIFLDDVGSGA